MTAIDNWNGKPIAARRSRGGVLTFERWEDNVLGSPPWPDAPLGQVGGSVIDVASSSVPVFARMSDGREVFWVRMNNSTRELPEIEVEEYVQDHW